MTVFWSLTEFSYQKKAAVIGGDESGNKIRGGYCGCGSSERLVVADELGGRG